MTNEPTCKECVNSSKKTHKHIINADFAFIALTVSVMHSFLMVYTVVFLS